MSDFKKDFLGVEDIAFDTNQTNEDFSRETSTGGFQTVKKVNASHLPIVGSLSWDSATTVQESLEKCKTLYDDFTTLQNQNLNYADYYGSFADLATLQAAHATANEGDHAIVIDVLEFYVWDSSVPGWRQMNDAADEATNAAASASAAAASASAALTSETNAATSESNAATSATNASNAQAAAETAQAAAESAQGGAQTAETNAQTSETNAANSASSASNAQSYAEEWANKAEDSLVSAAAGGDEVDDYSAKHWANKAQANVHVHANSAILDLITEAFTTALKTKLDAIESGATADQTGAEIKTLLFALSDTNNLTDALLSKLNGIESAATADQSDSEIETAYNNQVSTVSQAEAEAGTSTTVRRWTAQRIAQAIAALAAGGGDLVKISTATASNSASVEFTGLSSDYKKYIVLITGLHPATDAVSFFMRTSTNNGSSYDSGSTDYQWVMTRNVVTYIQATNDKDDSEIHLIDDGGTYGLSSDGVEDANMTIEIFNPSDSSRNTTIRWEGAYNNEFATEYTNIRGAGQRKSTADVDAIQFLMSSGNISTGEFTLYGLK